MPTNRRKAHSLPFECQRETGSTLFKVQLSVPGGGPIMGEDCKAVVVRIDDNDFTRAMTSINCKRKAAAYT